MSGRRNGRRELAGHLGEIAHAPVLLVATDYDGTLSPIVADPAQAMPHREAIVALRALARLPCTQVAVISGRSLSDLAELSGAPEHVHLVGSHGSEFDPGFAAQLPEDKRALRATLERDLGTIAEAGAGLAVEAKPASIAFHYRNADEAVAAAAVQSVLEGPARSPGVQTRTGKKVIELSVVPTDKGQALQALRRRFGATAAMYVGDDDTDEDVFAVLGGPDLGVKVGPGETRAQHRIEGPTEVAQLLAQLAEERQAFLLGAEAVPIQEHSLLSDQRTVALVDPLARITWFCAPRIDSPALFADLLGGPNAGSFVVAAADGSPPLRQEYVDGTLVLRTLWKDFGLTDFLDGSLGRPNQRAGRSDLVRVIEGRGRVRLEFSPRLDFGRSGTELIPHADGLKVVGAAASIVLRSEGVTWEVETVGLHRTARAEVTLGPRPLVLELRFGTSDLAAGAVPVHERERRTRRFWTEWTDQLTLPSIGTHQARHGALVLRGLCHGPTGGIAAAATTSLPEHLGGVRNWDYRYCWLRDAAQSAEALVSLGSVREAMRFLDWVLAVLDRTPHPAQLRPLYTVDGGDLGAEAEIAELSGYAGSRPVRIGNAAAQQIQLDVFGPIAHLVLVLYEAGAPLSQEHWAVVERMVEAVAARWDEPDHGIWEIRARPRHHVHTKVMCWITLDRALAVAERFHGDRRPEWEELRGRIGAEVLERGWSEERGAFTSAYGSEVLDAAALWVGLSGLVPPGDERFARTVSAVEEELAPHGLVYRYLHDDGLPGREGAFLLCTSWLVDALLLIGRRDDAQRYFERLCTLAGRTGCLAEQHDPETDRALGNHPQAYSHLGLILNALHLERTTP